MPTPLHSTAAFRACEGLALVVARGAAQPGDDPDIGLELAATVGEREARGDEVRAVVLRMGRREESTWVRGALQWLAERGRRVVVRTSVRLSRELEQTARRYGATIMLELAHRKPAVQAALLGGDAEPAAALLLHAQHLRRIGLEVAVQLGPLLPVIHDDREDTLALIRHIAIADIRDAHLQVGRLTQRRFEALRSAIPSDRVAGIIRAYGRSVTPGTAHLEIPRGGLRLAPLPAAALYHAVRMDAEGEGLRIDHCGCRAQCHLDPGLLPDYAPLTAPDLFADAG